MTAIDILTRWLVDLLDPAGKWARVTHEGGDDE